MDCGISWSQHTQLGILHEILHRVAGAAVAYQRPHERHQLAKTHENGPVNDQFAAG